MRKFKLTLFAVASSIFITGCGSVNLTPPQSNIPEFFKSTRTKQGLNLDPNWWLMFNDQTLNKLIEYALEHNTDLAIAIQNIKVAQHTLELSSIDKRPTQSLGANLGSDKNFRTGEKGDSNSIRYSFNYEVDLWNKLEDAKDAKEWALKATEQEREVTKLSLISSIISLYYKSMYLSETIKMAEASVAYSKKLLDITTTKYKVGSKSGLDLAQARKSHIEQEYALNEYKHNFFENTNALKALLNLTPNEDFPDDITIPQTIPTRVFKNIKSDIPSNVLKNRPDVLAAEMRIQEAFYDVKGREADFYPKISLTGSLGNSTAELLRFINNPIGTIAANIQFPILDYARNKEHLRISESRYNIQVLEYQKSLISAMQEVENRLSFYYYNKNNYEKTDLVLQETKKISAIYEARYEAGASALQDLLDAQERERAAYLTKLRHIYDLINSESQVYQALGGRYH